MNPYSVPCLLSWKRYVCLFVTKSNLTEVLPCSILGKSWPNSHNESATEVAQITMLIVSTFSWNFALGILLRSGIEYRDSRQGCATRGCELMWQESQNDTNHTILRSMGVTT